MSKKESANRNSELTSEKTGIENGEVPHDEVARVAYALWEARGCGDGSSDQDWFEAERQLRESRTQSETA